MRVFSFGFAQFGFQDKGVTGGDSFSCRKPSRDQDLSTVIRTGFYFPHLETLIGLYENNRLALDFLQRR